MITFKNFALLTIIFSITVSFLLTGCGVQENPVATGFNTVNNQLRPFKGNITGSSISVPTNDPFLYSSSASATGISTHIGSFTKTTIDTFNVATLETWGTFTMIVASGDELRGSYSGYLSFGEPGHYSWELDAEFTGGTGRFASVSGSFVFLADGIYEIIDGNVYGSYTETFNGNIVY